jgi:hypothetical protein
MKRWLAVGVVALALGAQAATESLVDYGDKWWFSVKPEFQFSKLGDDFAALLGVQAGPQLGRTFYIGAGYYALLNSVTPNGEPSNLGAFDFWYAGLTLDYTFFSGRVVHGSVNALLGGGRATPADSKAEADLFVVVPGVSLQVNVTPSLELGVGAGWRFTAGADGDVLSDSDLGGPWGSIFLRWNEH